MQLSQRKLWRNGIQQNISKFYRHAKLLASIFTLSKKDNSHKFFNHNEARSEESLEHWQTTMIQPFLKKFLLKSYIVPPGHKT